jgi:carboxyl-terminal processing protease
MLHRTYILLLGAAAGALSTLLLYDARISQVEGAAQAATVDEHAPLEQFREIYELVHERFVTPPDGPKLIEGAINGLVQGLDPHSEYLDAQSFRTTQEEARGFFGGLGVQVSMEDGLLTVVAPIPNSHAAKAGLKAGDVITRIDDMQVRGLTINQSIERLRGPVDSALRLTIMRKGQPNPRQLRVVRDLIRVHTVSSRAIGSDVGYIKIAKFNDLTGEDLRGTLEDLSAKILANRHKGYVLDLRNNPGGVLEQAILVSNIFLRSGDIVVTRGRNPEDNKQFTAVAALSDPGKPRPLIVLINGGSASAAEIVAGALQDNRRATILGTRSFGKGSVQSILPVGASSGALKLTTAFYYTPRGYSIQGRGITPDIEVAQEEPGAEGLKGGISSEATLRNHLKGDGEERSGSESYVPSDSKDDRALNMALDLLRGAVLHPAFLPN